MKLTHIVMAACLCVPALGAGRSEDGRCRAARDVVERVFPQLAERLSLSLADPVEGRDCFTNRVENNRLMVEGSSAVALCRGVYDYVRRQGWGIDAWSGRRLQTPDVWTDSPAHRVVSPFAHHYYLNVVTYGYTMPYWDWARWERELDWMALHGIDMPLALVAQEAIMARVWRKLGLTDEEIAAYSVGPAHLPWMRMGNISGVDGPLTEAWHKEQVALQHRILERMRRLGMTPICPAFAGFVPQSLRRLYPDIRLTETSWSGFHNWMLSPEDDLFLRIGEMFIREWEREFGRCTHYLADSFNEMDIPFPPKDDPARYRLLASYGDRVYRSISAANPDATWVMQGWMFGYQRDIWDDRTLAALLSRVPDDRMLLLDLAVDYSCCFWHTGPNWEYYHGFHNKPWVYSVIPNMGGKTAMTGILPFYANGHLKALQSAEKGRLTAFGMAPEGLENNEILYELLCDAGWSATEIDVEAWLRGYAQCRYGCAPEAWSTFCQSLLGSVYGTFTDHPRFRWQFRPGRVRQGTVHASPTFNAGVERLADEAGAFGGDTLFSADFMEWAAVYVGGKAEVLLQRIDAAYAAGDTARAAAIEPLFVRWLEGIDRMLEAHPTHSMARWIARARAHGGDDRGLADAYETNARRIVTIWGPPVDDYSARLWSGLVRDYYLPRWQHYFAQRKTGQTFDFAAWERQWVEQRRGISAPTQPAADLNFAIGLVREAARLEGSAAR